MFDIFKKAEDILRDTEFFLVSVRELNKRLKKDYPANNLSDEELADILRTDGRFHLFSSSLEPVEKSYSEASLLLLEKHGITMGPRVMLRSRIPTKKEVVHFLMDKANQTFETLKKAWDMRPSDDENTEDQLLEALAKAQRLQRQLKDLAEKNLEISESEEK